MKKAQKKILRAEIVIVFVLLLAVLLPQLIGTTESKTDKGTITSASDLNGKKFVSVTGSIYSDYVEKFFPDSECIYVSDWSDLGVNVEQGKAEAFLIEKSSVEEMKKSFPQLVALPSSLENMEYSFMFSHTQSGKTVCNEFDAFIDEFKKNGKLDEIYSKWFSSDNKKKTTDTKPKSKGSKGELKIASCLDWYPFCYQEENGPQGYFLDIANEFCAWAGYTPVYEYADIQSSLAGFEAGKYDMFAYGFCDTPERQDQGYFSTSLYGEGVYAMINKNDYAYNTTSRTLSDVKQDGVKIATMTGTEMSEFVKKEYPDAEIMDFDTFSDMYNTVSSGKADYATVYLDDLEEINNTYDNLALLYEPIENFEYSFAAPKNDKGAKLCSEYDKFVEKIKQSGEYDTIISKWEGDNEGNYQPDDYRYSGEKGKLKIATIGTWKPKSFYSGETLCGSFIELMCYFCQENGYIPEFHVVSYAAEIAGIQSGEYDIVVDSICRTPTRLESTNMTQPVIESSVFMLTRADTMETETTSKATHFISSLMKSFEKTFLREGRWKMFLSGLWITILLALLSGLFGSALGCLICAMRMSKNSFLTAFARIYIKVLQGMPIVVMLMLLYYVVFGNTGLTAFWVCIIGFSLDFSAYSAEIFRSGIEAIPSGQARAALALGFSKAKAFRKVILPQAMTHILPVLSGQFISTVKLTSVAGYISVQNLTKMSDIIRSRTYEAFFPLIATAIIYYLIAMLLISILKLVERKTDIKLRSRKPKGVKVNAD
ncbi:MAG: ABC transporter permease subunit [Eubacterium sp.]|nr:ABC transporter permease subunit [Eubacterium sp.]